MGLFVVVLLVAIGASSVTPSSQEALPRSFAKREAQGNYYAPDAYYADDPYYTFRREDPPPAEEEESSSSKVVDLYFQLFGKEKEECGIERLSPPIIIIAIFLGIIMAVSIGVLPPLQIPPIIIPLNGLLLPNLLLPNILTQLFNNPGIFPVIQIPPKGRASSGDDEEPYYGNLIAGSFDMLTNHVMDVIESEECGKRLLCESGKYVEGRELLFRMMDFFVPEVYQNGVAVMKDSALEQMNCTSIACSYIDDDCFH
ncbi:uncharacterized protein LOC135219697 [Macrobrachium nipponense]|uniref:uncharacterized protein LOC135219697 n=1 Tax=Macrobrachium nipponense TaxID=159736 RepID=UPI0030C89920